ncbi:MAG: Flp family type IVb pilin [Proteobacteria bacterium]|nr:Flp family type IVb pilin [Pseudomonadota bacterium]
MLSFVRFYLRFVRAKLGATAIEYGFLAALIAIAMLGALTMLGDSLVTIFDGVTSDVVAAQAAASGVEGNCGDGEGAGNAECENK